MSEASESKEVGMKEVVTEEKKAPNSQKYSKETWRKVKAEFQAGTYLSLNALAKKYGIHPTTLNTRMNREKWNDQQRTLQNKVEAVIESKVVQLAEKQAIYLERLDKRSEKYERMLDASADNLGSKDANGTPLVDPDMLDTLSRSELRVLEMRRTALKIPTASQVDHLSGGVGLVQSFVSAISKLRQDQASPKLNDGDVDRILDAGVE